MEQSQTWPAQLLPDIQSWRAEMGTVCSSLPLDIDPVSAWQVQLNPWILWKPQRALASKVSPAFPRLSSRRATLKEDRWVNGDNLDYACGISSHPDWRRTGSLQAQKFSSELEEEQQQTFSWTRSGNSCCGLPANGWAMGKEGWVTPLVKGKGMWLWGINELLGATAAWAVNRNNDLKLFYWNASFI